MTSSAWPLRREYVRPIVAPVDHMIPGIFIFQSQLAPSVAILLVVGPIINIKKYGLTPLAGHPFGKTDPFGRTGTGSGADASRGRTRRHVLTVDKFTVPAVVESDFCRESRHDVFGLALQQLQGLVHTPRVLRDRGSLQLDVNVISFVS